MEWRHRLGAVVLAAVAGLFLLASTEPLGAKPANQKAAGQDDEEEGSAETDSGSQNVFPAADRSLLLLLTKARQLIEQERYAEAVQCLGTILDSPEDAFFRRSRGLKAEAQAMLGRLPRQGRELYELQYGAGARRMLTAAAAAGDAAGLAEVSRRFFHTYAGYEATLLLGLHYWNHGSPLAAALTLKRLRDLSPIAEQFEPALSMTLAACWLRAGSPEKAGAILEEVKRRFPQAVVRIGGKETPLSTSPASLMAAGPKNPGPLRGSDQWLMFRGNPERNGSTSAGGPLLSCCWRIPATDHPYVESLIDQIQQSNREQDRWAIPAFHPLVVNNVVLMRTARNLLAVDFVTGKRIWEVPGDDPFESLAEGPGAAGAGSDMLRMGPGGGPGLDLQAALRYRMWGDATFGTLSSDGQRVFAVEDLTLDLGLMAGRNMFIPNRRTLPTDPKSYNRLSAYDIRTGKLVWHLGGSPEELSLPQAGTFFLGPPLPLGGQLYVIGEQKGDVRLLALDARTGSVTWTQQLAVVDQDRDISQDPLRRVAGVSPSYADGILVCPTSNKSVVALEPATRSLLWGYVYKPGDPGQPQQAPTFFGSPPPSDPEPANRWAHTTVALAEGRVLMTPVDSGELHCLNVIDGKPLWRKPRQDDLYLACVHQGKVILVGRRGVRALRLADAETAWERKFDGTAMPSGTGFASGGRYYVPLNTAEVAAIDLDLGQVAHTYRSRRGAVPGNLVCASGRVISQRAGAVEEFFQLDALRRQVDARLAARPNDAEALAERGEILWDDGKLIEAVECLRRSVQLAPSPNARALLRDALLEGLRNDFANYRKAGDEIQRLIDEPRYQAAFLRLMAEGFERQQQFPAAMEHYLKLIDLDKKQRELESIDKWHSVRRDRWIQVKLAELREGGTPEVRAALDQATKARFDAALAAGKIDEWEQFLDYFGGQPLAVEARARLAGKLRESGRLLQAEMLLRRIERSEDRPRAAGALAELAAMLRQAKLAEDAAVCYARLGREYAGVICGEGKTGRQHVEALPADDPVRRALAPAASWPTGAIVLERKNVRSNAEMAFYSVTVPYQEGRGPFFSDLSVQLHQNPPALRIVDGWGKVRWTVSVSELMRQESFPMSSAFLRATVRDHLLLLSIGFKIVALDTLAAADRGSPKVLWIQDLEEPVRTALRRGRVRGAPARMPGHRTISPFASPQFPTNIPASISEGLLCYQRFQTLYGVDPVSGEVLWVREDIRPDSVVFGDERYVLVLPPEKSEAMIFRADDGRSLGTTPALPAQRLVTLGRLIASWRPESQGTVLELIDPLDGRPVWPAQAFDQDAKVCAVDNEAVGVFEPRKGHFTLVRLVDGRKLIDHQMQPEAGMSDLHIFPSAEQTLLVISGPERATSSGRHYYGLQGVPSVQVGRGKVYAFDPQGKPLWKEPVSVRDQFLVLHQPRRLPALIFACSVQEQRTNPMGTPKTTILAVDKRTGQVFRPKERFEGVAHFRLEASAEAKAIEIRLQRELVSLKFTDQPVKPADKDVRKKPAAKPSSALLKAFRRAVGLPSGADEEAPE
jgi:outer membrane protein assembly factor BamB